VWHPRSSGRLGPGRALRRALVPYLAVLVVQFCHTKWPCPGCGHPGPYWAAAPCTPASACDSLHSSRTDLARATPHRPACRSQRRHRRAGLLGSRPGGARRLRHTVNPQSL